ncbi:hypothetical protein [Chitinophaga sp. Ak27]|uniref:hypothetical protein n=1 Tax=Chitinophaga sp. Ak27 TaxID=2726116 RepID=UPI001B7CE421|nr:hypothetical protein [Chitinophaga sp. Ak27]
MDEIKDRRYIKEIIREYNARFASWGPSDSWDLDQFKTLENMIFELTNTMVSANTLKRFFQQRTGNPQLATRDVLCRLLGYTGYIDFVMKKTQKEEPQAASTDIADKPILLPETVQAPQETPAAPVKPKSRRLIYFLIALLLIGGALLYTLKISDSYTKYQLSKIAFAASDTKGMNPLTVTFSYDIPSGLLDDIQLIFEEPNGDTLSKKLSRPVGQVNATYIFEGDGFCHLQYKGKTFKTIGIEIRKPGWSVFTRNERKSIFRTAPIRQAYHKDGYVSMPLDSVVPEARLNHLFVSYVFYKEQLVNGDNFMLEARVRNSALENAIPRSDVMLYILSDSGRHGFALNEAGYAYIKFISGEKTIMGDEYNLSGLNFNASEWHVMGIRVENKKSAFYLDGKRIWNIDYNKPIGEANEIILRFKGCGAVDYVKLSKLDGQVVYQQDFNEPLP